MLQKEIHTGLRGEAVERKGTQITTRTGTTFSASFCPSGQTQKKIKAVWLPVKVRYSNSTCSFWSTPRPISWITHLSARVTQVCLRSDVRLLFLITQLTRRGLLFLGGVKTATVWYLNVTVFNTLYSVITVSESSLTCFEITWEPICQEACPSGRLVVDCTAEQLDENFNNALWKDNYKQSLQSIIAFC